MANETLPITGAVLTWARERSGISLEEASARFRAISEWEGGFSSPTYPQLEALAEYFHVPIAVFFFPEPPLLPPIEETFRTLRDAEIDELPPRIRYLLRRARAFQLNLSELHDGRNPSPKLATRHLSIDPSHSVDELAITVREFLGVTIKDQVSWTSIEIALENWREALLNVGIYVFKDAFRTSGYFGFSLYDENFPIIYVNNSSTKTRQIFTLFHELAHLLFHTSGLDGLTDQVIANLPNEANAIEVWCNRFASSFLIPNNSFSEFLDGRNFDESLAETLADRFKVSREVIFRRFLDQRLVNRADYEAAVARWNAQRRAGGRGGDWYGTQLSYLGRDYVSLAFQQFHQNRITESQLGEYLETKPKNLSTLESYYLRSAG